MKKRRFKIQRRLGVVLPGMGDKKAKGPIERRPKPPGFHGGAQRRRISDFGVRLKEKQKIRFHYGIKEKQLKNLIKKSKKKESNWMIAFVDQIERRLDNIVFRLGFYPTIKSARQAVGHGHVFVNGKKITVPGYTTKIEDKITLKEKAIKSIHVQNSLKEPTLELASYLELKDQVGKVISKPQVEDIPFEFESRYFIEFYGDI